MDQFYLTVDQIAGLTPRQKHELYFHRRNKQGQLVAPEGGKGAFKSKEEELAALEAFHRMTGGIHNFDRVKAEVCRRWDARMPELPARPPVKTFGGS